MIGRRELESLKSNPVLVNYIDLLTLENPLHLLKNIKQIIFEETGLDISLSMISHIRRTRLKYSRKRISHIARKHLTPRIQLLRKLWRDKIFDLDIPNFIYIDESHFDFRIFNKPYGHFKKGK